MRNGNDAIPVTINHDGEAPPYSELNIVDEEPELEDPPPPSQFQLDMHHPYKEQPGFHNCPSKNPKDAGFNDR